MNPLDDYAVNDEERNGQETKLIPGVPQRVNVLEWVLTSPEEEFTVVYGTFFAKPKSMTEAIWFTRC